MLSETITLPKSISENEDRFVIKLKDNLLRIIKEVNKKSKEIEEVAVEQPEPDYTKEFNEKANADQSGDKANIGNFFAGEIKQNLIAWGNSLTQTDHKISDEIVLREGASPVEDKMLVSSQNVYKETHPPLEEDDYGQVVNPYHYLNYREKIPDQFIENINKQDRWYFGDLPTYEINDNTVVENFIALDNALYKVAMELENKANISMDNLNYKGQLFINNMARQSILVRDLSALGVEDPLVKVDYKLVKDEETGLYTDVYTIYSDGGEGEGGGGEYIAGSNIRITPVDIDSEIMVITGVGDGDIEKYNSDLIDGNTAYDFLVPESGPYYFIEKDEEYNTTATNLEALDQACADAVIDIDKEYDDEEDECILTITKGDGSIQTITLPIGGTDEYITRLKSLIPSGSIDYLRNYHLTNSYSGEYDRMTLSNILDEIVNIIGRGNISSFTGEQYNNCFKIFKNTSSANMADTIIENINDIFSILGASLTSYKMGVAGATNIHNALMNLYMDIHGRAYLSQPEDIGILARLDALETKVTALEGQINDLSGNVDRLQTWANNHS